MCRCCTPCSWLWRTVGGGGGGLGQGGRATVRWKRGTLFIIVGRCPTLRHGCKSPARSSEATGKKMGACGCVASVRVREGGGAQHALQSKAAGLQQRLPSPEAYLAFGATKARLACASKGGTLDGAGAAVEAGVGGAGGDLQRGVGGGASEWALLASVHSASVISVTHALQPAKWSRVAGSLCSFVSSAPGTGHRCSLSCRCSGRTRRSQHRCRR